MRLRPNTRRKRSFAIKRIPEVSAFKFWRRLYVHALLWGNGYAWIEYNNAGKPMALYNLLPDRTCAKRVVGRDGQVRLAYETEVSTPVGPRLETLPPEQVFHIEGVATDNLAGCDITQKLKNAWAVGLALERHTAKFFKNGARLGGILEIPNTFSRTAAKTLEEGFTKKHTGPENWFKVAILRDGAKFHSTTVSPEAAKVSEANEDQVRQVARSFNLPPSKLGLADSASYGSKSEDNQAYLDQTLNVWLCAVADECRSKLLTEAQRQANTHYFEQRYKPATRT